MNIAIIDDESFYRHRIKDIVILLSNLIDNAIEACQKVEADRYI